MHLPCSSRVGGLIPSVQVLPMLRGGYSGRLISISKLSVVYEWDAQGVPRLIPRVPRDELQVGSLQPCLQKMDGWDIH